MKKNKKPIVVIGVVLVLCLMMVGIFAMTANSAERKLADQLELGQKYLDELDYEQAIMAYKAAIEIDPKCEEAYLALAEIYVLMEDYEYAIDILDLGIEHTDSEKLAEYLSEVEELYNEIEKTDDAQGTNTSDEYREMDDSSAIHLEDEERISIVAGEHEVFESESMPEEVSENPFMGYDSINYSGETEGLKWIITDTGELIVKGEIEGKPDWSYIDWAEYKEEIISATMEFSGAESLKYLFDDYINLQSVDLSKLDTGNVKDMTAMFQHCSSLSGLDLSGFDTSKVMYMDWMFSGCSSIKNLDLSSFDTSNVVSMNYMFQACEDLNNIDLSSFNTSNVTTMSYMFFNCHSLVSLDLYSFDTYNVTKMSGMFDSCKKLTKVDLRNFDLSSVKDMGSMFYGCRELKEIFVGAGWEIRKDILTSLMFSNCGTNQVTLQN